MSTYVLTIVKDPVTVPTIPGDLYPEDSSASTYMFSSFSGAPYIVDLTISLFKDEDIGEGPVLIPEPMTSLSVTTPGRTGVTFTTLSSTSNQRVVRASGTLNDAVFNSTYDLVLPPPAGSQQYEIVRGVSGTIPGYLAVIKWTPPTVFSYEYTSAYSIIANSGQPTQASVFLNQFSYWGWQAGLATFRADLAAGSI